MHLRQSLATRSNSGRRIISWSQPLSWRIIWAQRGNMVFRPQHDSTIVGGEVRAHLRVEGVEGSLSEERRRCSRPCRIQHTHDLCLSSLTYPGATTAQQAHPTRRSYGLNFRLPRLRVSQRPNTLIPPHCRRFLGPSIIHSDVTPHHHTHFTVMSESPLT